MPMIAWLALLAGLLSRSAPAQTLAERLGFSAADRVLIVNMDDIGMTHASNAAAVDCLEHGLATSGSVMVPTPWFAEIAAYAAAHPAADFGVHLTHTSEGSELRWRPLTCAEGLTDPHGFCWASVETFYAAATPEEALAEGRAQVRRALAEGIDVTHLDSHSGALQLSREYFEVYRGIARELDLPVRMISSGLVAPADLDAERGELDADGILHTDVLILDLPEPGESATAFWTRTLRDLPVGVSELYFHPAVAGEENSHGADDPARRAEEYAFFTSDPAIRQILDVQNVKRIGWRAVRDLQRRMRRSTAYPAVPPPAPVSGRRP
jgi:predicted glycoside hydrolase/deacetylase ChbG (UPF0249 family)